MVNPNVFGTLPKAPPADTKNDAGGAAYTLPAKEQLVTLALTTTFNDAFYVSGAQQLEQFRKAARACEPEFVAKLAVYARKTGHMKDAPAALLGHLDSLRGSDSALLLRRTFPLVVDNGKMLRGFFNVVRSGAFGRKSFSNAARRLLRGKLLGSSPGWLLRASIGSKPTMGDILRAIRPAPLKGPAGDERRDLFAYLLGHELQTHQLERLPANVRAYREFKTALEAEAAKRQLYGDKALGKVLVEAGLLSKEALTEKMLTVPDVPMDMLVGLPLLPAHWAQLARRQGWQWLRMNLNTLQRQKAFEADKDLATWVAAKLSNAAEIAKARVFPYQLLATYLNVSDAVPHRVRDSLHDAIAAATMNAPEIAGNVVLGLDCSGSMKGAITGIREGATTKVRCVDVAALIASTVLRKNPEAKILPYDVSLHLDVKIEPRDSILTNAQRLAALGGGATATSIVLAWALLNMPKIDVLMIVSDQESWADHWAGQNLRINSQLATRGQDIWYSIKRKHPKAKLVCIDIQPHSTSQFDVTKPDILQVAGWSDAMLGVIARWLAGETLPIGPKAEGQQVKLVPATMAAEVEAIELPSVVTAKMVGDELTGPEEEAPVGETDETEADPSQEGEATV